MKFAHILIKCVKSDEIREFEVITEIQQFKLLIRNDSTEQYYGNIPLSNNENIQIRGLENHMYSIEYSTEKLKTKDQELYERSRDLKIINNGRLKYTIKVVGHPQKIVVQCPNCSGFGGIKSPYSLLDISNHGNYENTLFVSFQDYYFINGSMLLIDESGNSLLLEIKELIVSIMKIFNLAEDKLVFIGSSKGAITACQISNLFKNNHLIVADCIINTKNFFSNVYSEFLYFLEDREVQLDEIDKTTIYELKNKHALWLFSNIDHVAIKGIEDITSSLLLKKEHSTPHGQQLKQNLNIIEDYIVKI